MSGKGTVGAGAVTLPFARTAPCMTPASEKSGAEGVSEGAYGGEQRTERVRERGWGQALEATRASKQARERLGPSKAIGQSNWMRCWRRTRINTYEGPPLVAAVYSPAAQPEALRDRAVGRTARESVLNVPAGVVRGPRRCRLAARRGAEEEEGEEGKAAEGEWGGGRTRSRRAEAVDHRSVGQLTN